MPTRNTKNIDVIYIQRIGFIGSILLIGITMMNLFVETGTYDYPLPRILIAISILTLAILSFRNRWVRKRGLKLLYLHFFAYNFYGIALVAINHFQPIDTSATILIGFALCAFIRDKKYLNAYLAFLLITYLGFYITAESTVVEQEYFLLVLFFILSMGYMIFNGKLETERMISESKVQLENSEKRFRSIFEKSPVGIVLMDLKMRTFAVNDVFEKVIGYNQAEFIAMDPSEYIYEEDYLEPQVVLDRIRSSKKHKYEIEQRFVAKDGDTKWVRRTMAMVKMEMKAEYYIVSMMEDITFQKEANVKLNDYANKLKMHNRALEEFSYVISHDLQEPLRMIKSYTGLIKRRYIDQIDDKNAHIDMDYVIDGADRMSNLIRDMLAYSQWTAKQYKLEVVNTRDVLVDVIKNLTMSISEKNGSVICHDMPEIITNRLLFGQVLQNLIGNGLKYYCEERNPNITITAESRDSDFLFSIKDNGQGFDEKDKERIFGIFQRLHGRDSNYKGTGIGLAICKRIIEKQGGKIWADGEKGKGATFFFTIPKEIIVEEKTDEISKSKTPKRKLQLQ